QPSDGDGDGSARHRGLRPRAALRSARRRPRLFGGARRLGTAPHRLVRPRHAGPPGRRHAHGQPATPFRHRGRGRGPRIPGDTARRPLSCRDPRGRRRPRHGRLRVDAPLRRRPEGVLPGAVQRPARRRFHHRSVLGMRNEHLAGEPRVSVVTPFYNTAPYIAACIESVLGQTHSNFEYLLVDNRSTDGSRDIAARYAARDGRIRLIDNAEFLGQLANFNRALDQVDPASRYVKMLLADDVLFPDALSRLVEAAERDPRTGLVAAYYLHGDRVDGSGLPLGVSSLPGREALRRTFLAPCFLVGTPSTVLYRADIVRSRRPFFTDRLHADTEAAYEILLEHHLGFVHQVLSFVRTDNESISSAVRDFFPIGLDNLIVVERFGRAVLSPAE